jgi:hypothetical protein
MLESLALTHQSEKEPRSEITIYSRFQCFNYSWMALGEHERIGPPIAPITKFAAPKLELPSKRFPTVFNEDQFTVLMIGLKPASVSSAPPCSSTPPGGRGRGLQHNNSVSLIVEE